MVSCQYIRNMTVERRIDKRRAGVLMKKQNENGRISEDRLSRANKRKKNNTIASILVMTGCLLVLVLGNICGRNPVFLDRQQVPG